MFGLAGVKSVRVGKDSLFVLSSDCLMSRDEKVLIRCFSSNSSFTVPDSVRSICPFCFDTCNVKRVVLGKEFGAKNTDAGGKNTFYTFCGDHAINKMN